MSLIKKAKRSEAFLKLALSGPSGSGKTYSALLLAKGLMGGDLSKVVIVDTENGSANLYDSLGDYSVLPFEPPYHPGRYCAAIEMAVKEGFSCIIIDSLTNEWSGLGGCLDLHTKFGGKFQDWARVTPLHNQFIDTILHSKAHIIGTIRKKQDHIMTEKNGKMVVEKVGMKDEQRDNIEYEFTTVLNINMDHFATASKDRTELFADGIPFKINEKTGEKLRNWCLNQKP